MRADVATDLSDSSFDFMRVVVPAVRGCIGGGRVEPVECSTSAGTARDLDVLAGIDAWQVVTDQGVRGLGSRVQWGDRCWRTFTIREHRPNGAPTELEKRRRGSSLTGRGYLYPHLTVQAYLTMPRRGGCLLGAAVARTDDILEYVGLWGDDVPDYADWRALWRQRNGSDGVTFVCVPWDGMRERGYVVKIVGSKAQEAAG